MSARLARRSLPGRLSAFTALFLSVLLGTALAGSFATLLEIAERGTGVSDADAETLRTMGLVIGGWGAVIVLFAVVSTTGVLVAGREQEIALLRAAGATPRQIRRLVRTETAIIAGVGAALGALIAWPGGALLLEGFRDAGLVEVGVEYVPPLIAAPSTALVVVLLSLVAAGLGSRKASKAPVRQVMATAATSRGLAWWRWVLAVVLIGYGAAMAVVTVSVTADADDPYAAMQTAGTACIIVAAGVAAIAPALLRGVCVPVRAALAVLPTSAGVRLGVDAAARRADLLGAILGPVIVMTSTGVGVTLLVDIDARTIPAGTPDADLIRSLNGVVVGLIVLFAAVLVVNATRATLGRRRAEVARLRLLAATPKQVRTALRTESALMTLTGLAVGGLASTATIVPFSIARDEGGWPNSPIWLIPAILAGAAVITWGSHIVAARALPATRSNSNAAAVLRDANALAQA